MCVPLSLVPLLRPHGLLQLLIPPRGYSPTQTKHYPLITTSPNPFARFPLSSRSYIKRWSPAEGHSLDAELVTLEEILTGDWGAVAVLSGTDPDVILRV